MHEYGVAASLLKMVEEHAAKRDAQRILRVEVRVGELSGLEVDLLETAWSLVRERSRCEDVPLSVTRIEARWGCPRCETSIERGALLACPRCSGPARLEAGDELLLGRIEMEVS